MIDKSLLHKNHGLLNNKVIKIIIDNIVDININDDKDKLYTKTIT